MKQVPLENPGNIYFCGVTALGTLKIIEEKKKKA
jgi:hypothetical protein